MPDNKTIIYDNSLRYAAMYECGTCGKSFAYAAPEPGDKNPNFCPQCGKPIGEVKVMTGVYV